MPPLSGSTGNIRSNRDEPLEVMSKLVAEFFRQSANSGQALLCRSLAHSRSDPQQDCASLQGDGPKTAPIAGISCIVDSVSNVLVEPNFTAGAIKRAEMDRPAIARGEYDLYVVDHSVRPDILKLSVDSRPKRAVAFKGRPPLSVVQEPDVTTEPNEDAQCSD